MKKLLFAFALLALVSDLLAQPISQLPSTNRVAWSNEIPVLVNPRRTDGFGTWRINISNLLESLRVLPNWPGEGLGDVTTAQLNSASNHITTNVTGIAIVGSNVLRTDLAGLQSRAITNINEQTTIHVFPWGNDSTGNGTLTKPYLTPLAARNAAVARTNIFVHRGLYPGAGATNLFKNGVNWHSDGATLSNSLTASVGFFDNTFQGNSGAITSRLSGQWNFICNGCMSDEVDIAFKGMITVSNPLSRVTIEDATFYNQSGNQISGIRVFQGHMDFTVSYANFDAGGVVWYWDDGDGTANFKNIDAGSDSPLWCEGAGAANWFVTIDYGESILNSGGGGSGFIYFKPTHNENKLWLTKVGELYGASVASGYGGVITVAGGKFYLLDYGKISAIEDTVTPRALVDMQGGQAWISGQKTTLTNNQHFLSQTGGMLYWNSQHWQDAGAGSSTRPYNFITSAGTNYIGAGDWKTTWGPGMKLTGGRSVLRGLTLDTTATTQPTNYGVWITGGVLEVDNPTIRPGGTNSIFAATSHTVVLAGGLTAANVHPNISWSGSTNNFMRLHAHGASWFDGILTVSNDLIVHGDLNVDSSLNAADVIATGGIFGDTGEFTGNVIGPIRAYDATTWNGSAVFATEDAVRDKIESLVLSGGGGGPGSLPMAATQFDTNSTVHLISGAKGTNLNMVGTTHFTNNPAGGSPQLRLWNTNGNSYTALTLPDGWKATNVIVMGLTNVAAGEYLQVLAVTVSGGVATIILTNGTAQPLDSDLTAIAALTTTAFGRGLLDDADGTAARATIGAVIGTDVQAFDADLSDLADGSLTGSKVNVGNPTAVVFSGSGGELDTDVDDFEWIEGSGLLRIGAGSGGAIEVQGTSLVTSTATFAPGGKVQLSGTVIMTNVAGSAAVINASSGPNQRYTLAVNTNLPFAPLSGTDASNSIPVVVTFAQDSTGGRYVTNNGATIYVRTNASAVSYVTYSIIGGITNVSLSIPFAHTSAPLNGQVPIWDAATQTYTNGNLAGGGDALVANPLSQFAATTSAQLFGVLSDEVGSASGALAMFNIGPYVHNGSTGPGYLDMREDSDNGANRVRLIGPASTADVDLTLQATTGTIYSSGGTDVAVADGGTGISSGTSGGVPYFSGSTTIASSGALAANALVIGGGAGVAPSTTTTASGALTFLGTPTLANLDALVSDANIARTDAGNTLTGSQLLAEGGSVALDPSPSADGAFSGTTVTGTAGATLAFGDLIVLDVTDSRWELADANSASGADGDSRGMIGICVQAAASDGSATTILLQGIVRADAVFPTFTVNAPLYVSETAGDVTGTSPTTEDNVVRILGAAFTADSIYFAPDRVWVVYDVP